jgi:septum site-determining protein MinC
MNRVNFKGEGDRVFLVIYGNPAIEEIISSIREKVSSFPGFFAGMEVFLSPDSEIDGDKVEAIRDEMSRLGLTLRYGDRGEARRDGFTSPKGSALIVKRTLRSGQRVEYDGDIVVLGDVNPGAEVVASGNVIVLGTLRGVAHAGSRGKGDSFVLAFKLMPTQIRIGRVVSRAPEGEYKVPDGPGIAFLRDGEVIVEDYHPGHPAIV